MININDLTEDDVERSVVYTDGLGNIEDGIIKSWNDKYIFVRFAKALRGQAVNPKDLKFLFQK